MPHSKIIPLANLEAKTLAVEIIKYGNQYLSPFTVRSDQGGPFASRVFLEATKAMGTNQHFTVANVEYPRAYGETGIRVAKNSIRKFTLCSGLPANQWNTTCDNVSSNSNNLPSVSLLGRAPNDYVYGTRRQPQDFIFVDHWVEAVKRVPLTKILEEQIERFQQAIGFNRRDLEMHRSRASVQEKKLVRTLQNNFVPLVDSVFIAELLPANAVVPRWNRIALVIRATGDRSYEVKEWITNVVSEQHVSNLRHVTDSQWYNNLSNWDMIFWAAYNRYGISFIDSVQFQDPLNVNSPLQCKVHYSDERVGTATELVSKFLPHLPLLFQVLCQTDAVPDGPVLEKLYLMLDEAGHMLDM